VHERRFECDDGIAQHVTGCEPCWRPPVDEKSAGEGLRYR
jgi:hypothetical protein